LDDNNLDIQYTIIVKVIPPEYNNNDITITIITLIIGVVIPIITTTIGITIIMA